MIYHKASSLQEAPHSHELKLRVPTLSPHLFQGTGVGLKCVKGADCILYIMVKENMHYSLLKIQQLRNFSCDKWPKSATCQIKKIKKRNVQLISVCLCKHRLLYNYFRKSNQIDIGWLSLPKSWQLTSFSGRRVKCSNLPARTVKNNY
jgi:hypothetical protein